MIMQTVFSDKRDWSIAEIRMQIDEGDIIPSPDYQRDYVFDNQKASKLIESMLMGIPIPPVYLAEEADGTYTVIDGQQRIMSFKRYLDNDFQLTGLLELSEFNGLKYKDLESSTQKVLKNGTLSSIILKKESSNLKYEIFARLNIGSVKLKPQELRNCVYRGPLNAMIEDLARNNPILPIMFHDENRRKVYQERILRFFALRDYHDFKSSMNKTMNAFMESHLNADAAEIEKLKKMFISTIELVKTVLGEHAFYGYDRKKKQIVPTFSGSIYDSIMIAFSRFQKHDLQAHADHIRSSIEELKTKNIEYQENTYAATGSRARVISRIELVYRLLSEITGVVCAGNTPRLFSEAIKEKLFFKGYICSFCKNEILSIDDAEIDHVMPFSKGGTTDIENAQLLHKSCNRMKSDSENIAWEDESSESDDDNYEGEPSVSPKIKTASSRRSIFRFSMVGIQAGTEIIFDPTGEIVKVHDDLSINYRGKNYRLSAFVREYMPEERKNASGAYQGPKYFSYHGKILDDLRTSIERASHHQQALPEE